MKTLFSLIAIALTMASCSKGDEPIDYIPAVVIARELGYTNAEPPIDFIYHPPAEIVLPDTCESYQSVSSPAYITGVLQFDVNPASIVWMYNNAPVDLSTIFPDFDLYWSGHNVALIAHGTNNHTQWQQKIWCRDGSGAKQYLSFSQRQFNFLGAITPPEQLAMTPQILSARRFGFYNSGLSCTEAESLIQILSDNCVSGTGKIMDLRFAPCIPNADLMQYLTDSNWTILQ